MKIKHYNLADCSEARGCVVVIDVIRAFTTAAFAFGYGASGILSTDSTASAYRLKQAHPDFPAMGEESDGVDIGFFEMNNSPYRLREHDLKGKTVIHRTTNGTVGLIRPRNAQVLLAASLVNSAATARYIRSLDPEELDFVETGVYPGGRGDEDTACADYIESLLADRPFPHEELIRRVLHSTEIHFFEEGNNDRFPPEDLDMVIQIDRFDFAMTGTRLSDDCVRVVPVPVP